MRSPGEGTLPDSMRTPTNIRNLELKRKRNFSPVTKSDIMADIDSGKYGSLAEDMKDLLERTWPTSGSLYGIVNTSLENCGTANTGSAQDSPIIIIDSDDEEIMEQSSSSPIPSVVLAESAVDIQVMETRETCPLKHKLTERNADETETREGASTYACKENDTTILEGTQKEESNHQITSETRIQDENRNIDSNHAMLVTGNGYGEENGDYVDMEIDNDDDTQIGSTGVSIDMDIGNSIDKDMENDVNEQINLDVTRFSDDNETEDDDDLKDIWNEMHFGLECLKDTDHITPEEPVREEVPDCDHSFVLKEDIGYFCRVCGLIQQKIENIIEYQSAKNTRSTRSYYREAPVTMKSHKYNPEPKSLELNTEIEGLAIHPRHGKQMKPHQLEGFKFLLSNLVTENPGGCILAHAPGSGKTFMIISFMQSFLAKYPEARPLVVLPKGILSTWKKEFKRWQIEEIPLYDFYSAKAENRAQQLEVLNEWAAQRSILFLGYQQFSLIVCDDELDETTVACQKILLEYPSILILDEGHTPRNEDTDVLTSLKKVQTPRKVVLSGTLYQNHVKEVFTILDLVRPKFLRQESSRAIMGKISSIVPFPRKQGMEYNGFYESVESTLHNDNDFKRKIKVIQYLREMTSKVLHFYKGDFLDELPGLLDFTVFLSLSNRQKEGVKELKKINQRFKVISEGSNLYVHPELRDQLTVSSKKAREGLDNAKIDIIVDKSEIGDGVKAKFFLNLLGLCESAGEKLLVFSQYIQPLKFLERLVVKTKSWSVGNEIFVITGESKSESRDFSMERFNNSTSARVFFGSIKACGEGISLVGASRIIILDVHLNPSVTRQAIGRAFRPGQERKVFVYRLVAAESPEEHDHSVCSRKESIAKMWFEWNEYCDQQEFQMRSVDVNECDDKFLESSKLSADIKSLYQR